MLAIVGAILCLIGWQRFLFSTTLLAQAQTPAFEVASIKENKSEASVRGGGPQPGRFVRTNVTLRHLIQMAYSRRAFDQREMLGGPSWIDSARFDVEGKFGDAAGDLGALYLPNGKGEPGLVYLMVRTLLTDRFKLALHTESREVPVFALKIARRDGKVGPQLRRSDEDCSAYLDAIVKNGGRPPGPPSYGQPPPCSIASGRGGIIGTALTMSQLADAVTPYAERAVFDRTGLTGVFDFSLTWTPMPGEYSAAVPFDHADPLAERATSLFTALAEQLGLKLESTRAPVDVLVIDHVEKPTED
jgi:uncharacterized protein (TIGR03435 family)